MTIIQSQNGDGLLTIDTNSNAARVNLYGSNGISSTNIGRNSYVASANNFSIIASDFFAIQGSSSKIVYVTRAWYSGTQASSGTGQMSIILKSSLNKGGTYTYVDPVALDSNSPIATANIWQYSVARTTSGFVSGNGQILFQNVNSPQTNLVGIGGYQGFFVNFIDLFGQPIMLNDSSQMLCLNNSNLNSPTGFCGFQWYEE